MKATPALIKRIHGLLPKEVKQDPELKGDLVEQYTGTPSKRSTKDLEIGQAKRMISDLQIDDADNRKRKKFLSICHNLRWYSEGTTELDWYKIRNWLEKYGHLHTRELNDYRGANLSKLITQIERVLESKYEKSIKSGVSSKE